jgi:hypothetical protein
LSRCAIDKFLQAINQIWRLNSVAQVSFFALICDGSTDRIREAIRALSGSDAPAR